MHANDVCTQRLRGWIHTVTYATPTNEKTTVGHGIQVRSNERCGHNHQGTRTFRTSSGPGRRRQLSTWRRLQETPRGSRTRFAEASRLKWEMGRRCATSGPLTINPACPRTVAHRGRRKLARPLRESGPSCALRAPLVATRLSYSHRDVLRSRIRLDVCPRGRTMRHGHRGRC